MSVALARRCGPFHLLCDSSIASQIVSILWFALLVSLTSLSGAMQPGSKVYGNVGRLRAKPELVRHAALKYHTKTLSAPLVLDQRSTEQCRLLRVCKGNLPALPLLE